MIYDCAGVGDTGDLFGAAFSGGMRYDWRLHRGRHELKLVRLVTNRLNSVMSLTVLLEAHCNGRVIDQV